MLGVTETYAINPLVPTPQNGQTHSNISTAFCRRIVECCRPFGELALKGFKLN